MSNYDPYAYDPSDAGPRYLQAGTHHVKITAYEIKQDEGRDPTLTVTFTDKRGDTHTEYLGLGSTVRWRVAILFGAVEWTTKVNLSSPGMLTKILGGKFVSLTLADETYNGKTRTKMKSCAPAAAFVMDAKAGGAEPSADDQEIPF